MLKKPFFIVFEGVEGCGKSYQSKKLFNSIKKKNIPSILTREPGGTRSAEIIRFNRCFFITVFFVSVKYKNYLTKNGLVFF